MEDCGSNAALMVLLLCRVRLQTTNAHMMLDVSAHGSTEAVGMGCAFAE